MVTIVVGRLSCEVRSVISNARVVQVVVSVPIRPYLPWRRLDPPSGPHSDTFGRGSIPLSSSLRLPLLRPPPFFRRPHDPSPYSLTELGVGWGLSLSVPGRYHGPAPKMPPIGASADCQLSKYTPVTIARRRQTVSTTGHSTVSKCSLHPAARSVL